MSTRDPAATSLDGTPQLETPPPTAPRLTLRTIVIGAVVFWALPVLGLFVARYISILLLVFLAILFSTFLTPVVNRLLGTRPSPSWSGHSPCLCGSAGRRGRRQLSGRAPLPHRDAALNATVTG